MTKAARAYRLGVDLGSNSIGWFLIWLDEAGEVSGLGPGGVRVFADGRDPKSKASNAASRRVARGARRRRDRYIRRRDLLITRLMEFGLLPSDEVERKALEELDPYALRASALDGRMEPHHLGRALFHLNQRRGFKSNRKTDGAAEDAGAIKEAVNRLREKIEGSGARTLGEFLHHRKQERAATRVRSHSAGGKAEYDFYPSRDLVEAEFDAIWTNQKAFHPQMTPEARESIREVIFYQRPLRPPPVGKCQLDPARDSDDADGFRCSWAHPLAQRFRILQEVRNLSTGEVGEASRALTREQGDIVAFALFQNAQVRFDRLRSVLRFGDKVTFNLESEKRQALKGDETAARLAHKDRFGKAWRGMTLDQQIEVVEHLLDEADEEKLLGWLARKWNLAAESARRVAMTPLPDGHCRLGLRAIRALLPLMEGGMRYDEAATVLYGSHSSKETGEVVDRLPYYGAWLSDEVVGSGDARDVKEQRFGRLPNPTVHIGLGQLRRLTNALVGEYGPPRQIVVEMTRSFQLSPNRLRELEQEQAKNQRRNEERKALLEQHRQVPTVRNMIKQRWSLKSGQPVKLFPLMRRTGLDGQGHAQAIRG